MNNYHTNSGQSIQHNFEQQNIAAEELIGAGKLAEAAKILVDIVAKDPLNFRAYNNMGIVAWMQRAWEDAYNMFYKAVTLKADYTDALMNLFDAAIKLRKIQQALPVFEKALEVNAGLEEIRVIVEAIKEEGEHIYNSERATAIGGVYNPLLEEATKLLEEGQLYAAMEKFLEVNDKQGPCAEAFNGLGIISYYQKRYEDAFILFIAAIKLNPADPDTFLNLLDSSLKIGQTKKAIEIYKLYADRFVSLKSIAGEFEKAEAGTYKPANRL